MEALEIVLDEDRLRRFDAFEESLYRANVCMNLTRVPREECWMRHFVDSVLFHDLVPSGARVLDIGAGPGFPAWPLALVRPDLRVTALDSSGKMLGFLSSQPLENLTVRLGRAEEISFDSKFDFVTGRAVAPLGIQLELSTLHVGDDGLIGPMRSATEFENLKICDVRKLGLKLESIEMRTLLDTDIQRVMPLYRLDNKTRIVRRSWAEMKRRPLA